MLPASGQTVSIVVAMYNEEESLPQLFEKLGTLQSVKPRDWRLDFVLVNDGSSDRTVEVANRLKPVEWDAQILSHGVNRGFGAAIRTGFAAARGSIVVCYDADCTYPVEDIIRLVGEVLAGADVAT